MALDFTSDPAGLLPRLGKLGKLLYAVNGQQADDSAVFDEIAAQYASSLEDKFAALAQSKTGLVRSQSGIIASVKSLAEQTVLGMVEADQPAAARSIYDALVEVRRQMIAQAITVKACTVGVSVSALGSPTGTGVWVYSTKRGDGLVQENMFVEVGRLVCEGDSYGGGATVGKERFRYTGEPDLGAGVFDYDWPAGSAASASVTACSADEDSSTSGNLLKNGDFENWSADATPQLSNWAMTVATWGTEVLRSATGFRGSYALRLNASTTNTIIQQQFNASSGTPAALTPLRPYAVNLWLRTVSGTVSAGVLTVSLVDAGGTTINDQQGTPNSFTIDLTALTTSYVASSGVFRLPQVMPPEVHLRLRISTDLAGADVLIDDICFTPLTQLYTGGPYLAAFSGATPFVVGDTWTVTQTNDRGGASYLATFQALFDRFFGSRGLPNGGLLLPSDASPTVADTLITA